MEIDWTDVHMSIFTAEEPLLPELLSVHLTLPAGTRFQYVRTNDYFRRMFETDTAILASKFVYHDGSFAERSRSPWWGQ